MTLAQLLAETVSCLKSGIPIRNLNRLRRVRALTTNDTTTAILDELTRLHSHARKWEWPAASDEGYDLWLALRDPKMSADAAAILTDVERVLRDAGEVIARLSAECAGLRARGE